VKGRVIEMLKAIIVDDEWFSIERLSKLLKKTGKCEVCKTFLEPMEVLENISELNIDVVFLDIDMPEINGIQLSEKLMERDSKINIVFVTAYDEYAVEAFELNALDYLLKPVSEERLQKTISRITSVTVKQNIKSSLKVDCFGGFKVSGIINSEEKTIKFRTNKSEELLALLVIYNGKPISADYIIENLWPDFEIEKAMINLYTSVHYLRKAFKSISIDEIVKSSKGSYFIDIDKLTCNLSDFENIVNKLKKGEASLETLEQTIKIYEGSLFEGKDYLWVEEKREGIAFNYVEILKALSQNFIKEKNFESAVETLKEALKIDPLSEVLSKNLIKTYILFGDRQSALKYYNKYKKLLMDEVGIELNFTLKELIEN
jgi:two-component SAPR family response regulator